MPQHIPVMLNEALEGLNPQAGKLYIDATLGLGGHAKALLEKGCLVIGLDQDPQALKTVGQTLNHPHLTTIQGNFDHIYELVRSQTKNPVSGVLYDLGTSALQLDDPLRGFSFQINAPLDMRMNPNLAVTAADLLNALSKKELVHLLTLYAQEHKAYTIAEAIVKARKIKPFSHTRELAIIAEHVYPKRMSKIHPATKIFQALRMAVNDEVNALKASLPQALDVLSPAGRLVVISFHEGEDREVKQFMKQAASESKITILTPKPQRPQPTEIQLNARARSARLRCAQKI